MQYKRIPIEMVEHTELALKSYLEFERGKDAPRDVDIEVEWVGELKKLHWALNHLTKHQRKVYVMKVGLCLQETEIAIFLHISQSAVSQRYKAAVKKLGKIIAK